MYEILVYFEVLILSIMSFLPIILDKKFKFYSPVHMVSIIYVVSFGFSTLYIINNKNLFATYPYLKDICILKSMVFIIATFVFFLLGFYLPKYDKNFNKFFSNIFAFLPNINDYTLTIRNLPLILTLFEFLGWLSRIFIIKLGIYHHLEAGAVAQTISGFNLYAQYLYIFSMLPLISIILVFIEYLKKKNTSLLTVSVLLIILEIVYSLPSGGKERVLMPIFLILLLLSLRNEMNYYLLFSTVIFFLLFVFPFTTIFRLIYSGRLFQDFIDAFGLYFISLFGENDKFKDELIFNVVGQRLNYTEIVTNIIENTPRIWDFKLGSTYLPIFYTLIPRFLWRDKPEVGSIGLEFGYAYGYNQSYGSLTSVASSWIGEAFLNFGWAGILVGFFYGLLFFFLYNYFLRKRNISNISVLFYCFTFYSMIRIEGEFTLMFGGLIKLYFTLLLLLFPFIKKNKS